jgi:hypothetical protein
MHRLIYSAVILLSMVLLAAPPTSTQALQSPIATPTVVASLPPPISPLVWIAVGLIIGFAVVFTVHRTSPHDG